MSWTDFSWYLSIIMQGGRLPETNLPAGTIVMINAEGKQHALAIGKLLKSVDEMYLFLFILENHQTKE